MICDQDPFASLCPCQGIHCVTCPLWPLAPLFTLPIDRPFVINHIDHEALMDVRAFVTRHTGRHEWNIPVTLSFSFQRRIDPKIMFQSVSVTIDAVTGAKSRLDADLSPLGTLVWSACVAIVYSEDSIAIFMGSPYTFPNEMDALAVARDAYLENDVKTATSIANEHLPHTYEIFLGACALERSMLSLQPVGDNRRSQPT